MKGFLENFYNMDVLGGDGWSATKRSRPVGTWPTAASAFTRCRLHPDLGDRLSGGPTKLDVPILVIQGDADRILPYPEDREARLPGLIADLESIVIEGGPHAIAWTHAGRVNNALLQFVGANAPSMAR